MPPRKKKEALEVVFTLDDDALDSVVDEIQLPPECCGVCAFSHMDERDLVCYGNSPVLIIDSEDTVCSHRGAPVDEKDPICHLFKPRMHS